MNAEGLSMYIHRPLCNVWAGTGDNRKTGCLLGGHDMSLGDMYVRCSSPCCAALPSTLAEGRIISVRADEELKLKWERTGGGCIMPCTTFEMHAGRASNKKWKASVHVSIEPPPGMGPAGSTAQHSVPAERPAEPAQAVPRQLPAKSCTVSRWLDECSRAMEQQHGLAANRVDIWVWWPGEVTYFKGKVESFTDDGTRSGPATGHHIILYDDGQREKLCLPLELFSLEAPPGWLPRSTGQQQRQRQRQQRRRRRRQSRPAQDSEETDEEAGQQQQPQQDQKQQEQQRQQRQQRRQQLQEQGQQGQEQEADQQEQEQEGQDQQQQELEQQEQEQEEENQQRLQAQRQQQQEQEGGEQQPQQQEQQQQPQQQELLPVQGSGSRKRQKREAFTERDGALAPAHSLPQPSTPGQVAQASSTPAAHAAHPAPQQSTATQQQPSLLLVQRMEAVTQCCSMPAAAAAGVSRSLIERFIRFWEQQVEAARQSQLEVLEGWVRTGSYSSVAALLQSLLGDLG